jgi:DNA-binding winged helix-turn-helix (wHTH) protein
MKQLKARHLSSGRAHASGPSKRQRVDGGGYAAFEFGRSRLLLRQRQLLVDGVPVELGARAFDLLLALLEADGALVTKDELLDQVWPGIVVSEENLKVQVSRLRKALGGDRELIRTDFGRGYRFTGVLHSEVCHCPIRAKLRSGRALFPQNWGQSLRCGFSSSLTLAAGLSELIRPRRRWN